MYQVSGVRPGLTAFQVLLFQLVQSDHFYTVHHRYFVEFNGLYQQYASRTRTPVAIFDKSWGCGEG